MAPGPKAVQKSEKKKTRQAKPKKARKRKASATSRSHPLTISVTHVRPGRLKKVSTTKKAPAQALRPSSKDSPEKHALTVGQSWLTTGRISVYQNCLDLIFPADAVPAAFAGQGILRANARQSAGAAL